MGSAKTFRHGQILRLVTSERIANQEELRRRLSTQKLHVTQATLSRDLQELKLVKTPEGRARAVAIYSKARPGYHPITVATVDGILAAKP